MKKNNKSTSAKGRYSPFAWLRRMFFGASKDYADETLENAAEREEAAKAGDVEEIVSPVRQIFRSFMERKLAVIAVVVVILMFLLVFIGPLFMPKYDDAYVDLTQQNIAPNLSMMSVPKELKNDIKMIDSYSGTFSVGLSNAGKVYVWGYTQLGTTGVDIAEIPEEVQNAKIEYVAAGIDHIIAIGDDGKIYGWGHSTLGQYKVNEDILNNPRIVPMPEDLRNGKLDVANVKKLVCGYQCSAILMNDGSLYIWGNKNAYANLEFFVDITADHASALEDIDFTLNYVVGVTKTGSAAVFQRGLYDKVRPNVDGKAEKLSTYLAGRKIKNVVATGSNLCYILDDGDICFAGDFPVDAVKIPTLAKDEKFVQVMGGTRHYTGITNKGNVYSWGENVLGQCDVPRKIESADNIIACGQQNYVLDGNGALLDKWGLRGYVFGTDANGADIMQRVVVGGKMTMTIGAIAVIISTIIGIIVGCVSGYFGGKVDMLLMRITEIFAAIPFLPFALILSAIMAQMPLKENTRIFIIMCILGVLTWTGLARLVRGQVLVARENEYVTAAKAMGVKESKIAFKHILPNVISVILVTLTLDFAGCMLTESSLSYLGFGVALPRPTWGNMLNGANNETIIGNFWWQWFFPALFLAITTICINIVGDTLRDVMDPKSTVDR